MRTIPFMTFDAVVIGSGPNGLAAAIELARNGRAVCVYEARDVVGGGCRSAESTLPGFIHDTCAAIHPLGYASPFFKQLPLDQHGLRWIFPDAPLAHPLDSGRAALLERSIGETSRRLGQDSIRYARLLHPFIRRWDDLGPDILAPIHIPKHPFLLARFGRHAIRSALSFADRHFVTAEARALIGGNAGHSLLPLSAPGTAGFGLLLEILGHATGWPLVAGGSQNLSNALVSYFQSLGGEIVTGHRISTLKEVPNAGSILFDTSVRELLRIAGDRLPETYRRKLLRFRPAAGVFKMDWELSCPIPWTAKECARAGTLHVGGTIEQIAESEAAVAEGRIPEKPLVIAAQQSLFDRTRAPEGKHTAWGYCHVPNGCGVDMTGPIEAQIERFAPGFRDCILARHTLSPLQMETYNPNYIGGDITGGAADILQLLRRPILSPNPYATPAHGLFLCSASTPPGGGVHGMAGYHAARAVLRMTL